MKSGRHRRQSGKQRNEIRIDITHEIRMLRQVPKPSCSHLIDTAMIVIDATSARFPVKETQDVSALSSLRQGARMHLWPPLSEKSSVRLGDTTRSILMSIQ